jgi:rubrerythrin
MGILGLLKRKIKAFRHRHKSNNDNNLIISPVDAVHRCPYCGSMVRGHLYFFYADSWCPKCSENQIWEKQFLNIMDTLMYVKLGSIVIGSKSRIYRLRLAACMKCGLQNHYRIFSDTSCPSCGESIRFYEP